MDRVPVEVDVDTAGWGEQLLEQLQPPAQHGEEAVETLSARYPCTQTINRQVRKTLVPYPVNFNRPHHTSKVGANKDMAIVDFTVLWNFKKKPAFL